MIPQIRGETPKTVGETQTLLQGPPDSLPALPNLLLDPSRVLSKTFPNSLKFPPGPSELSQIHPKTSEMPPKYSPRSL